MGYAMQYESPAEIFDEYVSGLTRKLSRAWLITISARPANCIPVPDPGDIGRDRGDVPRRISPPRDGRARFVSAEHSGADELPDDDYPMILVTGRILQHWHTGVMTRRSKALHSIEPDAFVSIHPQDAAARKIDSGDWVEVRSRRGRIRLEARIETSTQPASIFIPFHFREAAANILTTDKLDPDGKIPEFKFCAVEIEQVRDS